MPLVAGRYRLGQTLGEGGMGKVWQARDEVLERDVAIKEVLLPADLVAAERDSAHRRTLREARAAARLGHPNVVQVFDVFDVDGRVWIVMAYVPSRSLHEEMRADGPLDPRRTARIGLDLLAALRAAHAAGVDHRDVKPANVLLADDGRVLLTDFGIATIEGDSLISSSDMLLGSPEYMSPERAKYGTAGLASDLWSLGATLYAAVEGRSPFHRANALATLTALAADEPDPPRQAGPLEPVLLGLLRKDPAERIDAAEAEHLLRAAVTEAYGHALVPVRDQASTTADLALPPPLPLPVPEDPAPADPAPGSDSPPSAASAGPSIPTQRAPSSSRDPSRDPSSRDPSGDSLSPDPSQLGPSPLRDPLRLDPSRDPSPHDSSPSRDPLRRWLVVAGSVVLVLVAVGVVWAMNRSDSEAPTGAAPQAVSAPATPGSAAPSSPAATSAAPSSSSSSSSSSGAGTSSAPAGAGLPALPGGWRDYRDSTGFAVYVPDGWTRSREGTMVYFRSGSRVLGIDQTKTPAKDPVADWEGKSRYRVDRGDFPSYREIGIDAVDYFEKAADWEFTFTRGGVRQHVNNRGVVTSDTQAYGFYWQTRDADWDRYRGELDLVFDSFRPAG
ncbi:serine/threonine-protein kinase [Paractinoplanes bogorensis]|uniref:serine/threonine-protein kinase n=1 Tax=Paractinoplanes bogorensis TaxID=1610840 RepID=UPI001FE9FDF2|nr:serine/threonine-protein kinase [Actinoplanes bogorensis]